MTDDINEFLDAYTTICEDFGLMLRSVDPFCGLIVVEADIDELEASVFDTTQNMRLENMNREIEEND